MSSIDRKQPQSKFAIYRHFAVGTVALAGAIAMLADDGARTSAESSLADLTSEASTISDLAEKPMSVRQPRKRQQQAARRSAAEIDVDGSFGAPTDIAMPTDQTGFQQGGPALSRPPSSQPLNLASLDRMSPTQRIAALKAHQSATQRRRAETGEQRELDLPGQPPITNAGPPLDERMNGAEQTSEAL